MRTELKIGIVLGIVVVLFLVVLMVARRDDQEPLDPAETPPVSSQPLPTAPAPEPPTDDDQPRAVVVAPLPRHEPCAVAPAESAEVTLEPVPVARQPVYHIVRKGETLWGIAERYYGHGRFQKVIHQANRSVIKNSDHLRPGWRLLIPDPQEVAE